MRTFFNSFAGGFLGKIVGSAFVAICAALGFGPDKWAAYMTSDFITPWMVRAVFILLGLGTLVFLIAPYFLKPRKNTAIRERLEALYKEGEFLKAVSENPAVYAQQHFNENLPAWTKEVIAHMRQFKAPDGKIFAFEVGETIAARLAILHGIIVQQG